VALGASRQQLLRLLLVKSVTLAVAGASLGIGGGLWVGRLLQSQLRGVEPADLTSLAAGTVVLVFVAIASSFVPAWRASRVDPAVALRDE
jgi:ABC-type antimicrobial peptide transport system permease subunit